MICQPVWKRQNEAVKVIEYIAPAVGYAPRYVHLPLQETAPLHLKSDNFQYNMLGRWYEWLIDQESDVPSIFFS